jgi:hypothetical protein
MISYNKVDLKSNVWKAFTVSIIRVYIYATTCNMMTEAEETFETLMFNLYFMLLIAEKI